MAVVVRTGYKACAKSCGLFLVSVVEIVVWSGTPRRPEVGRGKDKGEATWMNQNPGGQFASPQREAHLPFNTLLWGGGGGWGLMMSHSRNTVLLHTRDTGGLRRGDVSTMEHWPQMLAR